MIRWTAAGAVEEPRALQVRVSARFPGRVGAGAPVPSRDLTAEELLANVRHFTTDRRGPRTKPCTTLILGGLPGPGDPRSEGIAAALRQGRTLGLDRIVAHLAEGPIAPELRGVVDAGVLRLAEPSDLRWLEGLEVERQAVVVLSREVLGALDDLVQALIEPIESGAVVRRVVFTWPWTGAEVPPAAVAAAAVREPLARLEKAGIAAGVKGIPLCTLAPGPGVLQTWERRVWRSANRFYVDADHQAEDALVVFPDLLRLAKAESCRFCAVGPRCEGVLETWLRQGLAGPLVPLTG